MQKCNYNYGVNAIRFEWDERKNKANLRKHEVAFGDAVQVFFDPLRVTYSDQVVDGEERWHTIGMFEGTVLLLVVHVTWEEENGDKTVEVIRIISARQATPLERYTYEEDC